MEAVAGWAVNPSPSQHDSPLEDCHYHASSFCAESATYIQQHISFRYRQDSVNRFWENFLTIAVNYCFSETHLRVTMRCGCFLNNRIEAWLFLRVLPGMRCARSTGHIVNARHYGHVSGQWTCHRRHLLRRNKVHYTQANLKFEIKNWYYNSKVSY